MGRRRAVFAGGFAVVTVLGVAALVAGPQISTSGGLVSGSPPQEGVLSPDDIDRLGAGSMVAEVHPLDTLPDDGPFVDRSIALQVARANWGYGEEPPAAFLVRMTDPSSIGTVDPIEDRAVWIVRYSNINQTSPGGVELNWAYVLIDARTGRFLHSTLTR